MEYEIINNISNKYVPDWGNDKKYIAVHYLGCVGENYELAPDGTGAHFTVFLNGEIHQRCALDAVVWAVGTAGYYTQKHPKANNYNCISIEMCVKKQEDKGALNSPADKDWYFTEKTQLATVWLVKYLMKKLNIPITNVLRHYDIVNKVCPAPYVWNNGFKGTWSWSRFLDNVKGNTMPEEADVLPKDFKNVTALNGLTEPQKIKAIAPYYQEVQKKTGMLASVGLAQFCLESGYGTTDLAQVANNLHGMKCNLSGNTWKGSTWDGVSKYTKETQEQDAHGNPYYITADFRKYSSVKDSIMDRAKYFINAMNGTKKRYPNIKKCKTAKEQIELIKAGGYATDVNYVSKLLSIVERFDLTQYDSEKAVKNEIKLKVYRVQIGWYKTKARAQAFADSFKRSYKIEVLIREKDGGYMVQAGAFNVEMNAENRVKMLKSLYNVDAFYYAEEVVE